MDSGIDVGGDVHGSLHSGLLRDTIPHGSKGHSLFSTSAFVPNIAHSVVKVGCVVLWDSTSKCTTISMSDFLCAVKILKGNMVSVTRW
jgi:hypothetical protein